MQRFEEATAKLRERGIPAVAVPLRVDCRPAGRKTDRSTETMFAVVKFGPSQDGLTITIVRDHVPGCLPNR